jgi:protein-S-isoprenylcysteine O-methyltransferase Ste14
MLLLGPALLLAGVATMALGVKELGPSLTPWTAPAEGGQLVTGGVFEYVRHPRYAGLVSACAGLSVVTGSANRLLLMAVLLYVLDLATNREEEALSKKYAGQYESYKERVPGKFVPQQLLDLLPWMQE